MRRRIVDRRKLSGRRMCGRGGCYRLTKLLRRQQTASTSTLVRVRTSRKDVCSEKVRMGWAKQRGDDGRLDATCFSPAHIKHEGPGLGAGGQAWQQRQRAVQFYWLPDPAQRCLCCIRLGVVAPQCWGLGAGRCWSSSRVGGTGPCCAR